MTTTDTPTSIEVIPPLVIDKRIIDDLRTCADEVRTLTLGLAELLKRADEATSRAYAALYAHPHGALDDMWKVIPHLEELTDAVLLVDRLAGQFEANEPDFDLSDFAPTEETR